MEIRELAQKSVGGKMLERIKGIVPLGKKMLGGKNLSEDREPNVKVKNPVLAAAVLIAVGVFVTSCYYSVGPQAGEENLDGGTEQVDDGSGSDPDLGHLMGVDTDTETNSETDDTDTETDECSTEDEEPYEPEGEGIEKTITFETGPGEECDLDVRVYENGYVETAVFDHRIFYEEAMCPGSFPMEIGDIVIVQAEDSQYINAWGLAGYFITVFDTSGITLQNKCDLTEFEEGAGGPDGIVYAEIPLSEETHAVNAKSDVEIQVDLNADGVFDGHIVEDFEDLVYE